MKRKVIRRDSQGRPYLDHARPGEADVGDVRDVLRDGESLHVPLVMMDSADVWKKDMHRRLTATRTTADTLVIDTSTPPMVVDAFGGTEGLNRPGARYLVAGRRTVDHAVMTTLAAMRDEAYKAYDEEAQNAWRGNNKLECAPDHKLGALPAVNQREQAYAEYDEMMAEAWRTAR